MGDAACVIYVKASDNVRVITRAKHVRGYATSPPSSIVPHAYAGSVECEIGRGLPRVASAQVVASRSGSCIAFIGCEHRRANRRQGKRRGDKIELGGRRVLRR